MASAARDVAPRSAVTRPAWALCLLSILLALAALALAAVLALGQLSGGIGGTPPSWAVAAAALAVATLFQPARRRVQQAVDHTMQPTATSLWLRPSVADSAPASPPAST